MTKRTCSIEGCVGAHLARGWCGKHYQRWRTSGDPNKVSMILDDDDARFWSRVTKSDQCWEWTGTCDDDGYGRVSIDNRQRLTHRHSYELHNGPIPPGMLVCHSCDNPPCVRPDHLWLGTNDENMADCTAKGRRPTGDRNGNRLHPERYPKSADHPNARLTRAQVAEIRSLLAAGVKMRPLSRQFGVSRFCIKNIRNGVTYRDVTIPIP